MTGAESDFVEREIRIAARPEVVFEFFVDPVKMLRWKGVDALLDPRPGGLYRVNVTGRDIAVGEYVAIEPPHRVVFTWGWENSRSLPVRPLSKSRSPQMATARCCGCVTVASTATKRGSSTRRGGSTSWSVCQSLLRAATPGRIPGLSCLRTMTPPGSRSCPGMVSPSSRRE